MPLHPENLKMSNYSGKYFQQFVCFDIKIIKLEQFISNLHKIRNILTSSFSEKVIIKKSQKVSLQTSGQRASLKLG